MPDCWLEYFSGMNKIGIKRANRNNLTLDFLIPSVQKENNEMLLFVVAYIFQLFPDILRRKQ